MGDAKLTKAMRKAIRDAGPYSTGMLTGDLKSRKYEIESVSQEAKESIVTALNAIASEPEAVAAAREALLRAARLYDDAAILKEAARLRVAIREAKRATRGSR